jgi:hypothetical protein
VISPSVHNFSDPHERVPSYSAAAIAVDDAEFSAPRRNYGVTSKPKDQ